MPIRCELTCDGYIEAADVSTVDLKALTGKILSEEIRRPEFFVEILRDGTLLGSVHVGRLYPAEETAPADRWCVTFSEPNEYGRWCLSSGSEPGQYRWYVFCGAETQILDRCAVSLPVLLDALRKCCEEGARTPAFLWIDMVQAMNL